MASRTSALSADTPQRRLFWGFMAALALAQIAAFYLVCRDQVLRAQARDAGVQMQQLALADCLQDSANSTIGRCLSSLRPSQDDGGPVVSGSVAASPARATLVDSSAFTLPAHFTFR